MKQMLVSLAALVALTMAGIANAAPMKFIEGTHYEVLSTPVSTKDSDKLEVREFFFYGCPACNNAEPIVESWLSNADDDVKFVRTPVTFMQQSEPLARAFYVAENQKILDEVHRPLFDAIHKHRENVFSKSALQKLFAKYGVDKETFEKQYSSFSVNTKIKQDATAARDYRLSGVPAFTVNGKYKVLRENLRSEDETFQVVEYLLKKERKEQK